jgi:hypothetical protein
MAVVVEPKRMRGERKRRQWHKEECDVGHREGIK